MQSVKKKADAGAKKEAAAKKEAPAEQKYSIEMLRKHCLKCFGVTTSTFDGAMYGHTEDLTLKEAQRVIKEWLGKEVK